VFDVEITDFGETILERKKERGLKWWWRIIHLKQKGVCVFMC
jgi:hypothetical protein